MTSCFTGAGLAMVAVGDGCAFVGAAAVAAALAVVAAVVAVSVAAIGGAGAVAVSSLPRLFVMVVIVFFTSIRALRCVAANALQVFGGDPSWARFGCR